MYKWRSEGWEGRQSRGRDRAVLGRGSSLCNSSRQEKSGGKKAESRSFSALQASLRYLSSLNYFLGTPPLLLFKTSSGFLKSRPNRALDLLFPRKRFQIRPIKEKPLSTGVMCKLHRIEMAFLSWEILARIDAFILSLWPHARVRLIRRIQGPYEEMNSLQRYYSVWGTDFRVELQIPSCHFDKTVVKHGVSLLATKKDVKLSS